MRHHGPSPVPWKSMAYCFIYCSWALDQAQPGKHPFFPFTTFTFHFVQSNGNDWRKRKRKKGGEYESSIFKSGKYVSEKMN